MQTKTLSDSFLSLRSESTTGITFISHDSSERRVAYMIVVSRALRILHVLQQKGIDRGDELVFQIEDNYDFICVFWACLLGGGNSGVIDHLIPGQIDHPKLSPESESFAGHFYSYKVG